MNLLKKCLIYLKNNLSLFADDYDFRSYLRHEKHIAKDEIGDAIAQKDKFSFCFPSRGTYIEMFPSPIGRERLPRW